MAFRRLETVEEQREHVWTITGIPEVWGPVLLREWLETQRVGCFRHYPTKRQEQALDMSRQKFE